MRMLVLILSVIAAQVAAQETVDPVLSWQENRSQPVSASELPLDAFHWIARPVVVFADSPLDPRYIEQMEKLAERAEDLAERDVVIITDTDPRGGGLWRETLRPRGFMLVIMSKDGTIAARKPAPRDGREISRQIDKMPLRQQEMDAPRTGR